MALFPGTQLEWWLDQSPELWATALAIQAKIHKK